MQKDNFGRKRNVRFQDKENVLIRGYGNDGKWNRGIIVKPLSPVTYSVDKEGSIQKWHVDQIWESIHDSSARQNQFDNGDFTVKETEIVNITHSSDSIVDVSDSGMEIVNSNKQYSQNCKGVKSSKDLSDMSPKGGRSRKGRLIVRPKYLDDYE